MNQQKKPGKQSSFLAGKGFYVVLLICIVAVGISGYVLFFGLDSGSDDTQQQNSGLNWIEPEATTNPARIVPPAPLSSPAPSSANATPPPSVESPAVTPPQAPDAPDLLNTLDEKRAQAASPTELPAPPKKEPAPTTPPPASSAPPADKATSFFWPVNGDVAVPHSLEELLFNETMGDWRTHAGIDIEATGGASVCAAADGTVISILDDPFWGTSVVLEHTGGLTSTYGNLQPDVSVTLDAQVKAGDIIGNVGKSASAEFDQTPHLHFEMAKNGVLVDPAALLPKKAE